MLTAEQFAARREIGASDVPVIMAGTAAQLLEKYREKIGIEAPPDFANRWPVKLGEYMEPFILDWHERKTGQPLTERGRVIHHPAVKYLSATLDAYREHDDCTLDAKVCNSWQVLDELIAWYTPQAIVQRQCRGSARCALLIMHGSAEPREFEVYSTPEYQAEIFTRVAAFQLCLETLTPPCPAPPIVPPEQWRTVDLRKLDTGDRPNWAGTVASLLDVWGETKDAASEHGDAADKIKALIPADVGKFCCSGFEIKRNRANAISIKRGSL